MKENKKKTETVNINISTLLKKIRWVLPFSILISVFYYAYDHEVGLTLIDVMFFLISILTVVLIILFNLLDKAKEKNISAYRSYLLDELYLDRSIVTGVGGTGKTTFFNIDKEKETIDFSNVSKENINKIWTLLKQEKKDIIALMLNNNDEITEYFTISKKQAKSSYWFSIIAAVIGMFMLAFAAYGAIVVDSVDLTIIGVVGGAFTELVAGVVLWIHNKSAMQLNYYYDALHENERFLAAINMADKLGEEKREKMYVEIIRKQIEIHSSEKSKT